MKNEAGMLMQASPERHRGEVKLKEGEGKINPEVKDQVLLLSVQVEWR